ncbi:histidine kinase/DNA gyrase B/HSP90-like ATPase [Kribbella antiqua]|uniref:histidine kinase n=1 Tax=Kribbella antiqua TaxID=2512217 RepID=A0A4R2JC00_9ACTN|nr:ATP-binding protein [Kribbella antiqua]TCO52005.1 histidine kinase/DNA gyrase B/HSP90-like ATPase [Kribbella antiqua]
MPPYAAFWTAAHVRRREIVIGLAGGTFGVLSEHAAIVRGQPGVWLPDLAVGLVFLGAGLLVRRTAAVDTASPATGTATLLGAVAVTWFAGNIAWPALYWHRGPLLHLLLAYPGWRVSSRLGRLLISLAYVAAVVPPIWGSDAVAIALSIVFVAGVTVQHRPGTGTAHGARRAAVWAAGALGAVLIAGAAARMTVTAGAAVLPALWAYQVVLCAVAVGVAAGLRRSRPAKVADLVVELGETRSGTLRDALAHALGDPTLQVGFWLAERHQYVDPAGSPVAVQPLGGGQAATFVTRNDGPFAVLVHDAAILTDPALAKAVADTTRLTASHVVLQAEVRVRLAELAASRRRLLVAGDDERQRIEQRLRDGAHGRLVRTMATLRSAAADTEAPEALGRAYGHLDGTLADLQELARGLHPRELANGLGDALAALVERNPTPVRLTTTNRRYPPEVEVTAYYVCAEALANVAKYAATSQVTVEVAQRNDRLCVTIADDGPGGADLVRGSGLIGLTDRVETLGGTLTVHSPPGAGTRLVAELPLDTEQRISSADFGRKQ